MSKLDYPISVLVDEGDKITLRLSRQISAAKASKAVTNLSAVKKAINILIAEKIRNELGIIPEKEAAKLLKDTMGKLEKEGIVKKE